MRVCDVTREDEVTSAFTIIKHPPGTDVFQDDHDADSEANEIVATIETGKRATEALQTQAWKELHDLTPYGLRPKSKARVEGAAKAKATRAAKKAGEPAGAAQAAPQATSGASTTTAPGTTAGGPASKS